MSSSEIPECPEEVKNEIVKDDLDSSVPTEVPTETTTEVEEERETKSESLGQINKVEDSDEDIPGDFFDDFLKEDFMAGLDIVDDDEWDEDKIKNDADTLDKPKKEGNSLAARLQQMENVRKRKKLKASDKDSDVSKKKSATEEKGKQSKQKKKRREEKKDDSKNKKNSDKQIDADDFDIRRDPEKTKRDIARDKVRCEKDREMKIISEKLSLVETGLVPPGMEMEIDIEEIKKQKEKIEKSPRDLREHLKDLKGRNKSPVHKLRSPLRRRSLPRRSPILPLPRRRSRSPRRDSLNLIRNLSPIRRSPRRSPIRRISPRKSPIRLTPLRRRSSEKAFVRRRSRSHSPLYRSRRPKYSPYRHNRDRSSSRDSDRERWLKRRNRSRSPRKKRDEKKSFLQEIAEKLNEIRQPINMMPQVQSMAPVQPILQPMQPTLRYIEPQSLPIPVPAPAPVPAPSSAPMFPNPQQQYDPYDQSFFIGAPQAAALGNFQCPPPPSPLPPGPQMPLNPMSVPSLMPNNLTPNSINVPTAPMMELVPQNQPNQKLETQEDIAKLFEDKQISLSEFLAITAKPEVFSSSPKHLQEKIKVITRCHDAIKILESHEKKYSGKLIVHKTDKYKVTNGQHLSPLKSSPPVLFAFTDPTVTADEQKHSFTKFINDLLQKLGLLAPVVNIDDEDQPDVPIPNKNAMPNFSPPPPPFISPIKNPIPNKVSNVRYKFPENRLSKMVQTDVFKCESCEKRKKILYRSTGAQTSASSATFSVSTQVTEEDFQSRIPKTQSLAALTPAQLLAKSRESLSAAIRAGRMDADSFDHMAGYNRPNFFRSPDSYGAPRPSLPFVSTSSIYNSLDSQMYEGGGRGREPYPPRPLDPNVRFNHNNYY